MLDKSSFFYNRLEHTFCLLSSTFSRFFQVCYIWLSDLDNRNCKTDTNIKTDYEVITYTYCIYRFFRIGSIILALHDASDVFMEAAKVFKYSGREFGASVCFAFFAISWLILRLIFFPFWVIRSTRFVFLFYWIHLTMFWEALTSHFCSSLGFHFPALIFRSA